MRLRNRTVTITATIAVVFLTLLSLRQGYGVSETAELHAQELPPPDPTPSDVQGDYVGMTKCAACHYAQFKDWKTTSHGKAFEILPQKYRTDASCLECHSTGHEHAAGSSEAVAANLTGVSCEACHGPGGEHTRYGLTFVGQGRELTEESLTVLRSKIQRTAMDRCIQCHGAQVHKPHPEFDRDPAPATRQRTGQTKAPGFFQQVHR